MNEAKAVKPSSLDIKRDELIKRQVIKPDLLDNIAYQISQPHGFAFNLCGHCNFTCSFCPQSFEPQPKEFVSMEIVERLLNSAKDTPSYFQFGTRGENMLHPKVFEIFRSIKRSNPNHYITVNTNGFVMSGDFPKQVLESGIDQLIFSIQSIDPEVYTKLTGYPHHDAIMANIHHTINVRNEHDLPVMLGVQYLDTPENVPHKKRFFDYWADYDIYTYAQNFHPWGDKFEITADPHQKRYPCLYLWLYPNVSHKGNVCCCFADFYDENIFGNIGEQPLTEIWQTSPRRKEMIENHLSGRWEREKMCANCNGWTEFKNVFDEQDGRFSLSITD